MKVKVQTLDAKAGGDIQLDDAVFGVEPRADILHRVVTWQLINRRAPARAARERSDVARTGKKFGRQKGGGTARHGDRRAPIFVGGGKAHGPRARVFTSSLNKKVRALGLKMALSAKAKGGQLVVLDNLDMGSDAKTKALQAKIGRPALAASRSMVPWPRTSAKSRTRRRRRLAMRGVPRARRAISRAPSSCSTASISPKPRPRR